MSVNNCGRKFLVDGQLLDEAQVKKAFNDGKVDIDRLDPREKIALKMAGVVADGGRVLDVGCYGGSFVAAMKQHYPAIDAWGVDYLEDHIAIANLLYPDLTSSFRQMSVYNLDFPDASFDCVTFKEVIEHLCRPVDALREINRVLRIDGYLVLTTPNANADAWRLLISGLKHMIGKSPGRRKDPGQQIFFANIEWNRHIYAWTPATLNTLLQANGFEYIEHQFYCSSWAQHLFPEMGAGLAFLVRKAGPPAANII